VTEPGTLIVVAPGSRNPAASRTVEALVARLRYRLPDVFVRVAYAGVNRPSLTEALAEAPANTVVVSLLLGMGLDAEGDLAAALDGRLVAESLGPDRLLTGVLEQRLLSAGARPGQPVLLVAAGSHDARARGEAGRAARLLEERWGGPVRTAHLTGLGHRMSEIVTELGSHRLAAPAVAPYLLTAGYLHDKARRDAHALGLTVVADVLGDHPDVAETVTRRYRGALAHRFARSLLTA
jgi:sirohydrochlorin ferrochelatase